MMINPATSIVTPQPYRELVALAGRQQTAVRPPFAVGSREPVTVVPLHAPTTPDEPRIQPWNREPVMVAQAPITPPPTPGAGEPVTVVPPHAPTTPDEPRIQPWNRVPVMVVEAPITPPPTPGAGEPVTVVPPHAPTTPDEPRIQPWNREPVMVVEAPITPPPTPGAGDPVTPETPPTTPGVPPITPGVQEPVTVVPSQPPSVSARDTQLAKLRESAQQIEALMLKDIVARLRQDAFTEKPSDPMAGLATDMMNDAVAVALSRRGGIGIGRMLTEALTPVMTATPAQAPTDVIGLEQGA